MLDAGVKDILVKDEAEALKIIATGLKVLERQEAKVGSRSLASTPGAVSTYHGLQNKEEHRQAYYASWLQDVKQEGQMCHYRIAQEGLPLLLPHITKQRLQFSGAELLRLLRERSVVLPRSLHFPAPALVRLASHLHIGPDWAESCVAALAVSIVLHVLNPPLISTDSTLLPSTWYLLCQQ